MFIFYQTFILLAFHYVYRFVLLCNPAWLSWIQLKPWRNWISIAVIADVLFVLPLSIDALTLFAPTDISRTAFAPVLKNAYGIDLLSSNRPGYLAAVYWVIMQTQIWQCTFDKTLDVHGNKIWRAESILSMLIVMTLFFTSGAVIVYCFVRIVRELRAT
ncbi:hypothetical protein PMAYCL1PPCAC_33211, partial [Pristionchus mayeri]